MLYICEKALWFTSSDSSSSKWLENFPIFLSQACNIMFLASRLNTRISALTDLFGYAFWAQGNSFMDCMFNCLQDIHRLNVVLYFGTIQQSINHRAILGFSPCHVASLLLLLCVTWIFCIVYKSTTRCVGYWKCWILVPLSIEGSMPKKLPQAKIFACTQGQFWLSYFSMLDFLWGLCTIKKLRSMRFLLECSHWKVLNEKFDSRFNWRIWLSLFTLQEMGKWFCSDVRNLRWFFWVVSHCVALDTLRRQVEARGLGDLPKSFGSLFPLLAWLSFLMSSLVCILGMKFELIQTPAGLF